MTGTDFSDRAVLVTGAARGLGKQIAKAFHARGAQVALNDLEDDAIAAAIADLGGGPRLAAVAADISTAAGCERAVGRAVERFGRLDVLVTCHGILRDRMVFNMSEAEWDAVLAVHLKGTFNCVRHACVHMREQRYGRIVTFSSGAALFGNPGQANYGAAKGGISGLTKVAARDLGRYGVTVNAICPVAGTRMTVTDAYLKARELRKQQGIQREDRGTGEIETLDPNDVAPMVAYLASETARDVNGQFFLCWGSNVALLSQPRMVKTLFKDGYWTLDELDRLAPATVVEGLVNPAPPKEA